MRVDEDQPWHPISLAQPLWNLLNACVFEYGIAAYDNRYQGIAPKVQEIFERYGLTYTSGPLPKQVASAWKKVFRLALPNGAPREAAETIAEAVVAPVVRLRPRAAAASVETVAA